MKFFCDRTVFQTAIGIVEKAISQRSSLAILENIYLELKDNKLMLRGNDLEIGIQYTMPLEKVEEEGSVLVKAKTINSIVTKTVNKELNISVDAHNKMKVKADKVDFDILCTTSDEYPVFPEVQNGIVLDLTVGDIRSLIKRLLLI